MDIGISQLCLGRERKLDEWLPAAKAAGYDCIEILLTDEGDLPLEFTESDLQRLKDLSAASGVALTSICLSVSKSGNLTSGEPADEERFNYVVGRALKAAATLRIDSVLTIPGGPSDEVGYDLAYERALHGMRALAPKAEEFGVSLNIEYVWNGMFLSPREMRTFLEEVGSSRVGFYMDPGNMAMFSRPYQWVEAVGEYIGKVHFKDFKRVWEGEGGRFLWTALTEGEVNWPKFMAALRDIGYDNAVISEVSAGLVQGAKDAWDAHRQTAETMRGIVEM